MAQLGKPFATVRDSGYVNRIVDPYGGGEADEALLLNGLAVLGFDMGLLQSLSDRDPSRRFVNDAVVRARGAGVSRADIEKALRIGKAMTQLGGTYASRELGLQGAEEANYNRIVNQHAFSFKGEGGPAAATPRPAGIPGVTPGVAGPPYVGTRPPAQQQPAPPAGITTGPTGTGPGGVTRGVRPPAQQQPPPPPPRTEAEIIAYLNQNFGAFAWAIAVPQVGDLLRRGARERWDGAKFLDELQQTDWWKQTTAAQRQWQGLETTQPAQAQQQIIDRAQLLRSRTLTLGIGVEDDRLDRITRLSLQLGWTDTQINQALAAEFDYQDVKNSRMAGDMKSMARDYGITLSDVTVERWGREVIAGRTNPDEYKDYLTEQARQWYPTIAGALDRGLTVREYANPYFEHAAQLLGIDPNDIDLMDPKWSRAINQVDPKTGERKAMTPDEWNLVLRTDAQYGFNRSKTGIEEGIQLGQSLAKTFGRGV